MIQFLYHLLLLSAAGSIAGLLLVLIRKVTGTRVPALFWHAAWVLVFLRLVLPIPGLMKAPESLSPAISSTEPAAAIRIGTESRPESEAPLRERIVSFPSTNLEISSRDGSEPVLPHPAEPAPDASAVRISLRRILSDPALWFALWLAGAFFTVLQQLYGYFRFIALIKPSLSPVSAEESSGWGFLPGRKPELMKCPWIRTPMLIGFLHPRILLPEGLADSARIRMILNHELTHYRRGDLYVKWFVLLVSSIHWFNPLTRVFRAELDRVIELSCDASILKRLSLSGREAYGEALLDAAAQCPLSRQIVSVSFVTEKRKLKERLVQILKYSIPKKSILILLTLVLFLFGGCLAASGPSAASPSAPPPLAIESSTDTVQEEKTSVEKLSVEKTSLAASLESSGAVRVSDVDSLLGAIRPDADIILEPGVYDLTKAKDYGSQNTGSAWYFWRDAYDGSELTLTGVSNLSIRSATGKPEDVSIETRPRYANVLSLSGCNGITLAGITAGHTVEAGLGECTGGVISMTDSLDIKLQNCSLYGCGVLAVYADNCNWVIVEDSDLHECSYGAASLYNSSNIQFSGCVFRDCGEETDEPYAPLIEIYSCYGIAVLDSSVYGNRTATVLSSDHSQEVYFIGNTVDHPGIGQNSAVMQIFGAPVIIDKCAFTGSAKMYADYSDRAQSRNRADLYEADLSSMRHAPSDFDGFRLFELPEVTELTQEEAAALPLPESAKGKRTVKVSNIDEFLAAIAPETVIYLEEGTYNLSAASGYGAVRNEYFHWENPYDGPGIVISEIHGLQIVGAGKDKTKIVTEPRYVDVLTFEYSNDILLSGFTAGHTSEPGECIGGVLMFRNCDGIDVEKCGLFGCGIRGITGEQSEYMTVKDCEIYSCSLGAVQLESCTDCTFEQNSIHDCAYPTFQLFSCKDVVLDGKKLSPNEEIDLPGAGPYKKAA
ncbi:MAG: right-handed parallel beta-helix repeat-containing protein [Clostridiales bacterium]|nr:right-handed parallel beta-helix repeat-containing protein [Clostridiales bacterium]